MHLLLLALAAQAGPLDKLVQKAAGAGATSQMDAVWRQQIDAARAAAEARAGDPAALYGWLAALEGAVAAGLHTRGKLDHDADVAPALAAVDGVAAKQPEAAGPMMESGARLLWATDRHADADALARRSYALWPSPGALKIQLAWVVETAPDTLGATCKSVRATAKTDIQVHNVLDQCFIASGASDVDSGLAWASAADRATYAAAVAARAERAAARAEERAANAPTFSTPAATQGSSSASSSPAASAPTGPVSVSARITCNPKVRVYRGSSGGSGTYGWESYNSTVSYSVKQGDQVCVADASDKRQSCWTASGSARVTLEIGCGGISQR